MQYLVFTFLLVSLFLAAGARAGVYIIRPSAGSTCRGGEECTLQWMDDGQSPLLSAFGPSTAGLYTGQMKLVQPLGDVDTSGSRSFTFTVDPRAGPNSNDYYIALASKSLGEMAWSPFFRMSNMEGSFDSPLPSSAIPSLSTLSPPQSSSTTILPTITVGTLNTLPLSISSTSIEPAASSSSSTTPNPSDSSAPSSSATPATPSSTTGFASPSSTSISTPSTPTPLASLQATNVSPAPASTDVVEAISSRFVTSTLSPSSEPTASSANSNSSSNAASTLLRGSSLSSPLCVGAITLLVSFVVSLL
ncbi:hypothetical protein PC9H_000294 [Pleurotus ostreatus]|uniref:Yeast cell wall synthesis Kre9/Knh1-like N-terminal domain-containing protein n=1 Tax=Pleurotus ostreatus TaxID=5322 RepID=A0A8H7DWH6_PLEOS|nr:uncharacterized protein PC9H_000294 [Pleurotus ostreatus]KAF7439957.1 hypothetical protein PC9H_000294 [Pleurotus ostreatus]KAJ8700837.1 hypothetical protein PTI98_003824 [Pleurotus ostreatus]